MRPLGREVTSAEVDREVVEEASEEHEAEKSPDGDEHAVWHRTFPP